MKIGIQEISFRRYGGNYFKKINEYGFTAADYDMCDTESELYKMTEEERKSFLIKTAEMADEAVYKHKVNAVPALTYSNYFTIVGFKYMININNHTCIQATLLRSCPTLCDLT